MAGDMTKPRKKRHSADDFKNVNQKRLVEYLDPIIEDANITLKDFAKAAPKISLATVGNIFNPNYGKCPTPRIMKLIAKKIALLEGVEDVEKIYKDLLECDDKDIEEFPFVNKDNESLSLSNVEIENVVLKRLMNLPINGRVVDNFRFKEPQADELGFGHLHPFAVDYTQSNDSRISHWVFDITVGTYWFETIIRDFLYDVIIGGAANTVKYSLITDSEIVFNQMSSLTLIPLNVYVSVILYKDGTLIEKNIETSANQALIEEIGLYL